MMNTEFSRFTLPSKDDGPLSGLDAENSAMQLQFVASKFLFDPEGFESEKPLRRRPFYSHPYLTCLYCNRLYFLDISSIRYVEAQIEQKIQEDELDTMTSKPILIPPNESLKPCEKCKRVDGFIAGALDVTKNIQKQEKHKVDFAELEVISAEKILRAYRQHLQRMYTRAIYIARNARKQLKSRAATMIASIARGRLARRRYVTEKHLVNIRESHPLLIRYSLKIVPGKSKVFWYRRPVELKLVFANYVTLVERTGFQPPRLIVERNIAELSQRITARKNELVQIVQKRWRGFVARRIVRYFRSEIHRIFSHMVANSMRIQAVYRGHAVRKKIPQWKAIQYHRQLMQDYRHQSKLEKIKGSRHLAGEKATLAYKQERKDVQMSLLTDKIAYASELPSSTVPAMKAMNAFQLNKTGALQALDDSTFGDDRYMFRDAHVISEDQKLVLDEAQRVQADIDRLAFIKRRIAEPGPLGFGFRSGISTNTRVQSALAKVLSMKKECSRSKAMRLYFQREFESINQRNFERVSKNQRAISLAPGPLPDMAALDPYYKVLVEQREQKEKQRENDISIPKKKISAHSERLRSEFRLYNLSRLGDEAVINRPGSQKSKKLPSSLLENVKVPTKKQRESAVSSRESNRPAVSTPSTAGARQPHSHLSMSFAPSEDDYEVVVSPKSAKPPVAKPQDKVSFSLGDDWAQSYDDPFSDASGGGRDTASDFGSEDSEGQRASPNPMKGSASGASSSSSKLRVRRFRTSEEADSRKKETAMRAKLRAERAAMVAKRPAYKGYVFPQNINFNGVGWLYEEDEDVIYG